MGYAGIAALLQTKLNYHKYIYHIYIYIDNHNVL